MRSELFMSPMECHVLLALIPFSCHYVSGVKNILDVSMPVSTRNFAPEHTSHNWLSIVNKATSSFFFYWQFVEWFLSLSLFAAYKWIAGQVLLSKISFHTETILEENLFLARSRCSRCRRHGIAQRWDKFNFVQGIARERRRRSSPRSRFSSLRLFLMTALQRTNIVRSENKCQGKERENREKETERNEEFNHNRQQYKKELER